MLCGSHVSRGWLTAWSLALGLVLVGGSRVDAGQGAGGAEAYIAPRTPDGQPDLQGFWSNQTYTTLERPDGVTSAYYTPEELAARVGGSAARESAQTDPGTVPDVHYDFTQSPFREITL